MKSLLFTLLACIALLNANAQDYKIEDGQVKPEGSIFFETGSAVLKPESDAALNTIRKYLEEKTYITTLRVEGHVVELGDNNQPLSEARAMAVCAWLVAKGIDCKRLIPVGFGNSKPAFSDAEIARNNRIAFVNAALRGHAIGGMPADGGGKVAGDPCK